jgi:2-octaprenyl-6-methoxyphenol hydroxylase
MRPAFTAELRLRFGDHLGDVRPTGPRWSYPLRPPLARSYVHNRFALIGDAAHTIHPIAGQGPQSRPRRMLRPLAETVLDAARLGLDFGRSDVLERYERWRAFDSMALAAHHRWTEPADVEQLPAASVRGAISAMGIVDAIPPLRPFFMRQRRRCRHVAAPA